tara:strand:- start:4608 stop:5138 length:531 start_codon:yes stop_codon:yes gene_type:complete
MHRAIFLDRDGVINEDSGYLYKWEDFKFLPGVIDALKMFSFDDFLLIIVTNQSGISRGLYSEADFKALCKEMCGFLKTHGVYIKDIYFCPHMPFHEDEKNHCQCRKPLPGLILQAADKYNIDLNLSVMVGDKKTDILSGKAAGVGLNVLISSVKDDGDILTFPDLFAFAKYYLPHS